MACFAQDKVPAKSTPLSAPPLQTELALSSGGLVPRQAPLSNPQVQAAAAASSVLAPKQGKAGNHAPQDLMFQVRKGFMILGQSAALLLQLINSITKNLIMKMLIAIWPP